MSAKEFPEALNVTEVLVFKHLKSIEMVQKKENWVLYQLKPR